MKLVNVASGGGRTCRGLVPSLLEPSCFVGAVRSARWLYFLAAAFFARGSRLRQRLSLESRATLLRQCGDLRLNLSVLGVELCGLLEDVEASFRLPRLTRISPCSFAASKLFASRLRAMRTSLSAASMSPERQRRSRLGDPVGCGAIRIQRLLWEDRRPAPV